MHTDLKLSWTAADTGVPSQLLCTKVWSEGAEALRCLAHLAQASNLCCLLFQYHIRLLQEAKSPHCLVTAAGKLRSPDIGSRWVSKLIPSSASCGT